MGLFVRSERRGLAILKRGKRLPFHPIGLEEILGALRRPNPAVSARFEGAHRPELDILGIAGLPFRIVDLIDAVAKRHGKTPNRTQKVYQGRAYRLLETARKTRMRPPPRRRPHQAGRCPGALGIAWRIPLQTRSRSFGRLWSIPEGRERTHGRGTWLCTSLNLVGCAPVGTRRCPLSSPISCFHARIPSGLKPRKKEIGRFSRPPGGMSRPGTKNARTFPSTTISPLCGLRGRSLMKPPIRSSFSCASLEKNFSSWDPTHPGRSARPAEAVSGLPKPEKTDVTPPGVAFLDLTDFLLEQVVV